MTTQRELIRHLAMVKAADYEADRRACLLGPVDDDPDSIIEEAYREAMTARDCEIETMNESDIPF